MAERNSKPSDCSPLTELSKLPQVRLEDPRQVVIMWQTARSWPLGGIRLVRKGAPDDDVREIWMEHDDELHYYRGYDHWVTLTGLADGASYEYLLLARDADGQVRQLVETPFAFDYPDYHVKVEITGGPFVTNPGTACMSVVWRTSLPSGAAVDVRKTGTDEVRRVLRGDTGILSVHDLHHVVHLTRLEEGTSYDYRPVIFDSRTGAFLPAGEWRTFTTLSKAKKRFRALYMADLHGDRLKLAQMLERFDAASCDFVLYGGDMVWSAMHAPEAENLWDEFIHTSVEHFATTVPMVMVRGNHEGGGLYADSYAKVFHSPEGNTYHAFRCGDFLFVCLDSGDICPAERDCFPEFFARQREWLKRVLDSKEARTARFRIAVVHAPTHGMPDGEINERMRRYFLDLLNDPSPERRFQLCLGGHDHRCFRCNAGEGFSRLAQPLPGEVMKFGDVFLYTVMLNGGPLPLDGKWEYTVTEIIGAEDKVQVTMLDGVTGEQIDAIAIDAAGKVTELAT